MNQSKGLSFFQHCNLLQYINNYVRKKFYIAGPWTVVGVSGDTISFNNQLDTLSVANIQLLLFWQLIRNLTGFKTDRCRH